MKDIHPAMTKCTFNCVTCGSKFEIETTMNQTTCSIDICSKCHPFYIGKATNKVLSGRAEKLESKFAAGKANLANKAEPKKAKTRKSKDKINDLSSL